jgi:hypothetical protein
MSKYVRNGSTLRVIGDLDLVIEPRLSGGTYSVAYDPDRNEYYLQQVEDMTVPKVLYGDTRSHAQRVINTFNDRNGTTGMLLAGEKGCGKTLLGKLISQELRELEDMPTILINAPFHGDQFNTFIQSIDQPAILFFDEFEKVYGGKFNENQAHLLTLLDGTFETKKLFILTTNDTYAVNDHMKNRPSRLFYMLDYNGVTENFIREYCNDNLKDQDQTESLVKLGCFFREFNFDMLQCLVEEMNRFDEPANRALEFMNIKMERHDPKYYEVDLKVKGKTPEFCSLGPKTYYEPNVGVLEFGYSMKQPKEPVYSDPPDPTGIALGFIDPNEGNDFESDITRVKMTLEDMASRDRDHVAYVKGDIVLTLTVMNDYRDLSHLV